MKQSIFRFILTVLLCALVMAAGEANAQGTYTDRLSGSVIATIGKQPVAAATTANINLSGSQTIDGVTVSDHTTDNTGKAPDRVLVKNQTDTTQNGIYVVNNSGTWYLAQDFSGASGVVDGQLIYVVGGSINIGFWTLNTPDPICVGSSPIWAVGGCTASNITFTPTSIPIINLALSSGDLFIGNNSNVAVAQPMSGDCTISSIGVITCTKTNSVSFSSGATATPVNGDCMVATGGQWVAGSCTGPTGSGTVNIGTQYQIGYYGSSSNSISGNSNIWTNASGSLGIGTAIPDSKLSIYGGGLAVGTYAATANVGVGSAVFSGSVGIGTATPQAALSVIGHTIFEGATSTGATGTGNIMYSISPTTTGVLTGSAANFSGIVGIGTATPQGNLDVYGRGYINLDAITGDQFYIEGATNPNQQLLLGYSTSGNYGSIQAALHGTGAELLSLQAGGGSVAINATSQVSGGQLGIVAASGNTGLVIQAQNNESGTVISNASGTSTYNAEVYYINGFSSAVGSVSVSSGATAYNTSSDERIKTNLVAVGTSNSNGNIIDQLAPKTYNFIEAYDPTESAGEGFVAQSLYQIIPLAVTPGDSTDQNYIPGDGTYKMWQVDLSKIVPQIVADLQWVHSLFAGRVSCGAGTVNLTTFTITNGVVTHC